MRSVTSAPNAGRFEARLVWPLDHPVLREAPQVVNQSVLQINTMQDGSPDALLVIFGHISPPVLIGDPEEQAKTVAAMADADGVLSLPIQPVARVSMSRERAVELRDMLDRALTTWGSVESAHERGA